MNKYNHGKIEAKWQEYWQKHKTFLAKDFSKKPKKYVLVEFPYPSGEGLHMGHLRPYVAADVYARFSRMKGFEVLFPMGWDAFGLPAENYAIKMGVQPAVSTAQNVKNAKKQEMSWGLSFDWSREINTTDPNYYKWTQWLFLQFFKKGLAYEATGLINWCPKDKTGLANEEVIDGKCERCGTAVEKKELKQWYLKITAYAEKLLEGLKNLPQWPEAVKLQQENWIGKKTGINITYDVEAKSNFLLLHGKGGSPDKNFFPWLKQILEAKGFSVQVPELPDADAPNDDQQAAYVLKNCKIDNNTVIVGHSFGGVVALRLLEKGVKAGKVILIAAPFTAKFLDGKPRSTVSEALQKGFDFKKIKKQAASFICLYDEKDDVVSPEDGKAYAKNLDGALIKGPAQNPHFRNEQEPLVNTSILPSIEVFTTTPVNFGATFLVVSPEHPIVSQIVTSEQRDEVEEYVLEFNRKLAKNELEGAKDKTGVFTGAYAFNHVTKEPIPIWIADFVLMNVGTGAVQGCPGHDMRDFEFAKKHNLPIKRVVVGENGDTSPIEKPEQVIEKGMKGKMVNSDFLNGVEFAEAMQKTMDYFQLKGWGKRVVNYQLRDWVFSRQRYWGEPIPIIHCEDHGAVAVKEQDLPVTLPEVEKYEPTGTGESPLADIASWVKTKCPICKKLAWRETNTMPQWAGSSWYWLRYTDPKNAKAFAGKKPQKYWTPVDVYFGGMEHTTLHLLYSRFWNLFLHDQDLVTAKEPFVLRKPHGIILGPDGEKMSKSRGNVINPGEIVAKYGADTLRMYELFLGPHEAMVAWNDHGIVGVKRFLDRVWEWVNDRRIARLQSPSAPADGGQGESSFAKATADKSENRKSEGEKVQRALNKLTKKITEDIENFRFNTCVSAFMEFHNEIKDEAIDIKDIRKFLILLYPFAPHLAEELNQKIARPQSPSAPADPPASSRKASRAGGGQGESEAGNGASLQTASWPEYNPVMTTDQTVEIVVQANGRVKGKITMPRGSKEEEVKTKAAELEGVKKVLIGDSVKRVIYVPDKLINLVI